MLTFQAVYQKGVLKPKIKLDLPENTVVQVQLLPASAERKVPDSLFGAFPELASITEDDIQWAKSLWNDSAQKQRRIVENRDADS